MNDWVYWITIAHLPRWGAEKINDLIIRIYHENKLNWKEFFALSETDWANEFMLSEKQIVDLIEAKKQLPSNSFLAEDLESQGYDIIPLNSPEYSKTLKTNLLKKFSPPLLYVKGNKKILHEQSIAIVGSRDADAVSLQFADNIARNASKEYKVIVSGFARGVDKQALDSAISYKGQSIIVLPQGIQTFASGFKKYYSQIIEGDVLVLSTFHPSTSWSAGLAMARNIYIYGLASEIYVAQSSDNGGTWNGVVDGLKKNRKIFVRMPEDTENNANKLLIAKGAAAVNLNGDIIQHSINADDIILNSDQNPKNTKTKQIAIQETLFEN